MIWTIAKKEFLTSLLTFRFGAGLILCVVSVAAGTLAVMEDYRSRREAFAQAVQGYEEKLKEEGTYAHLVFDLKAFREPRKLAVFSVGSDRWQGNQVTATHHFVPEEANWLGAANPYLAIFRSIDLTLVVQFVLGLLALLFAYDAICGEREEGTLKMVLANRLPRDQVLLGKTIGHLAVLGVILLAGFLVALIVVQAAPDMSLGEEEIGRATAILAISGLYVTALYFAGLFISSLVQRPATALVLAITAWVSAVAIYPNAVAYAVDELMPMRERLKAAEESRKQMDTIFEEGSKVLGRDILGADEHWGFWNGSSANYSDQRIRGFSEGGFATREVVGAGMQNNRSRFETFVRQVREQGKEEAADGLEALLRGDWEEYEIRREAVRQAGLYAPEPITETEVERRVALLRKYFAERERLRVEFADRLWEDAWRPVEERMKRAAAWNRGLGMLSPAGAYWDASAVLARTDRGDYWRFLASARQYRQQLIAHFEEEGYFSAREWFNDQEGKVTLKGLPRFREDREGLWQALERAGVGILVLIGFNAIGFLGAYWRFRRYDVS